MYSDASELSIKNNRIELIEEGAFDASVRKFDFIGESHIMYCEIACQRHSRNLKQPF